MQEIIYMPNNILLQYYTTIQQRHPLICTTLTAIICTPILFLYTMASVRYTPYVLPILAGLSPVVFYVCFTTNDPKKRISTEILTGLIIVGLLAPSGTQEAIRAKTPDFMQPHTYIVHNHPITATPNHIIQNYWSSDARYAHIMNAVYDQRSLSITLNDSNKHIQHIHAYINDYANPKKMYAIIQQTYNH